MKKHQAKIINGQVLAHKILHQVRREIVEQNLKPSLAVILVGNNPASKIYVQLKQKACRKCGIEFYLYQLPKNAPQAQVIECLNFLNNDPEIPAIIIQLPLPKHLDENKIIKALNPKKDVDGFHPDNVKLLTQSKPHLAPGLSEGIIKLLKETGENLTKKSILIISNNRTFAKPLIHFLDKKNCAWISPKDKNLTQKTQNVDIIIIAVGIPHFLKAKMIKKHAILIDVGYNRVKNKPTGDVDFKSCSKKAKWISPVPGGVGPLTVAMLLANVVRLCKANATPKAEKRTQP